MNLLLTLGLYGSALEISELVFKMSNNYVECAFAYNARGLISLRQDDKPSAKELLSKAIELDPSNKAILSNLLLATD